MSDGYGYIYCFSNPSMLGIVKIGMTERTPEIRLSEANAHDTWRPPTPYKIEFAKKVLDVSRKEKILHTLLEEYTDRDSIKPRCEFFRVSPEKVRIFFDLMDGEMWIEDKDVQEEVFVKGCRDMTKCFTDGQRIRHKIGDNIWIGTYDSSNAIIIYNGKTYDSLTALSKAHHLIESSHRQTNTANGWKECECEIDGNWVSTYTLPN